MDSTNPEEQIILDLLEYIGPEKPDNLDGIRSSGFSNFGFFRSREEMLEEGYKTFGKGLSKEKYIKDNSITLDSWLVAAIDWMTQKNKQDSEIFRVIRFEMCSGYMYFIYALEKTQMVVFYIEGTEYYYVNLTNGGTEYVLFSIQDGQNHP